MILLKFLRQFLMLMLISASTLSVHAQMILQVVSKKVQTSFKFEEGEKLDIRAERANISIESWDKNEVQLELELVAKHSERSTAELAIKGMKYQAERIGTTVFLRNHLSMLKVAAHIRVNYKIKVPQNCNLVLQNELGQVDIRGVSGDIRLTGELCQFNLEGISGKLKVDANLGDLLVRSTSTEASIKLQRATLKLDAPLGNYLLEGLYAQIYVSIPVGQKSLHLDIKGDKSNIFIQNPQHRAYSYQLEVKYGDLRLPNQAGFQAENNRVSYTALDSQKSITAYTSFGNIVLE